VGARRLPAFCLLFPCRWERYKHGSLHIARQKNRGFPVVPPPVLVPLPRASPKANLRLLAAANQEDPWLTVGPNFLFLYKTTPHFGVQSGINSWFDPQKHDLQQPRFDLGLGFEFLKGTFVEPGRPVPAGLALARYPCPFDTRKNSRSSSPEIPASFIFVHLPRHAKRERELRVKHKTSSPQLRRRSAAGCWSRFTEVDLRWAPSNRGAGCQAGSCPLPEENSPLSRPYLSSAPPGGER